MSGPTAEAALSRVPAKIANVSDAYSHFIGMVILVTAAMGLTSAVAKIVLEYVNESPAGPSA